MTLLKHVLAWWSENLLRLLCWENPSLHWEKICKRQTALYRHIWGIRGKEAWGEKSSSTPQDLIYSWFGAQPQWGLAHFHCPKKQKLDLLGRKKKKASSAIFKLSCYRAVKAWVKWYFSCSVYLHKIGCFYKHIESSWCFLTQCPCLLLYRVDSCRKWGEANLIHIFHTLLAEGGIFAFKLCIYIKYIHTHGEIYRIN